MISDNITFVRNPENMSDFPAPGYKPLFNIRVYGILESDNRILVSDEHHFGRSITKFPGGGLQFGEGTTECLAREFREELNLDIEILEHFYTTDFFQPSAFDPNQQVVSIYYRVQTPFAGSIETADTPFAFDLESGITQRFRWLHRSAFSQSELTFPIDKKVAQMLLETIRA